MPKYRKKPIVVEAEQFWPDKKPWPACVHGWGQQEGAHKVSYNELCYAEVAHVHTLEGPLNVSSGDWIITGVKGERYPCKPEVFEATYDKVLD